MRCLKRNKRTLYLCAEYQDGYISKYKNPVKLNLNYQATNSEGDLIALGMDYPKYIRIKTDLEYANTFHAKDRVYILAVPSKPFDMLCKDADYEVDSDPVVSLNTVEITLKRLSGKNDIEVIWDKY